MGACGSHGHVACGQVAPAQDIQAQAGENVVKMEPGCSIQSSFCYDHVLALFSCHSFAQACGCTHASDLVSGWEQQVQHKSSILLVWNIVCWVSMRCYVQGTLHAGKFVVLHDVEGGVVVRAAPR